MAQQFHQNSTSYHNESISTQPAADDVLAVVLAEILKLFVVLTIGVCWRYYYDVLSNKSSNTYKAAMYIKLVLLPVRRTQQRDY